MSVFELIPTCDDAMSIYTLCAFVLYSGVLLIVGRVGYKRLDKIDVDADAMTKTINEMRIDVAVMTSSIQNIERDGMQTRTAIAEMNRILIDKLT